MTGTEGQQPFLRIVRGDATPEEIAALVAVVAATHIGQAPVKRTARSTWAHPARQVRTVHRHGDGAWRASGLPR